ncbi:hypothetical protein PM082_010081 [Marasmius tenuissimus]|nr:hypothetical protein PM082_010081 [Marasmius tenuissimus]
MQRHYTEPVYRPSVTFVPVTVVETAPTSTVSNADQCPTSSPEQHLHPASIWSLVRLVESQYLFGSFRWRVIVRTFARLTKEISVRMADNYHAPCGPAVPRQDPLSGGNTLPSATFEGTHCSSNIHQFEVAFQMFYPLILAATGLPLRPISVYCLRWVLLADT